MQHIMTDYKLHYYRSLKRPQFNNTQYGKHGSLPNKLVER